MSAGASSPLDESQKLELVNRRAQGVSIDIELLGELALGRQPFPWGVLASKDRGAQLARRPYRSDLPSPEAHSAVAVVCRP